MSTLFTWSARLLDAAGAAASGATLAVELFDLAANKWVALSQAATGADGAVRGRGEIGDDTLPFAPALRLVEGSAVMAATPAIARAPRGLNVDFGEVRRAPAAVPFIRTLGRGGSPFSLGGTAAATVDMAVVRAEVARDFGQQLADRQQDIEDRDKTIAAGERALLTKDADIRRLEAIVADRDRIIATPRPDRLSTDGAASITRVTDFASTIGVQLDDAQTALKSRGFSLGAIEVNAKGLLQDEGRKIEILDREALKTIQPGMLSDLKFSFRPDAPLPAVSGQTVPDLLFLTESRARAVLASLGLLLEASTGPAGLNPQAAPGQAMLQTPAAGTGLPRGGRVHVIFAAAQE
jgi:hypothetical protein